MGTNLSYALSEMNDLKKIIHSEVQKVEKELVETIFDILVGSPPTGTPVDTGWASANWMVTTGSPASGKVPDSGSVSSMKGKSMSSLTTLIESDLSNVNSIFITNRVSYIELLNNGNHSKQSIPAFIDEAVLRGIYSIKRKRIR